MIFENSIIVQKKLFEEYSQGINPNEIEWIRKKVIEKNPEWLKFEDKMKFEYYVLHDLNDFLYKIQKDNPSNIHAYVEKYFKEKDYDKKLSDLERHIWNLRLGQDKKYDQYQTELEKLLKEADKEIPGYSESRGRQISEINGDLGALRTNGKRGSTRMVQRIAAAQMANEKAEKKK